MANTVPAPCIRFGPFSTPKRLLFPYPVLDEARVLPVSCSLDTANLHLPTGGIGCLLVKFVCFTGGGGYI